MYTNKIIETDVQWLFHSCPPEQISDLCVIISSRVLFFFVNTFFNSAQFNSTAVSHNGGVFDTLKAVWGFSDDLGIHGPGGGECLKKIVLRRKSLCCHG